MKISKYILPVVALAFAAFTSQALAQGDVSKGQRIAKKCKACHTMTEGGKNGLGPNLYGVLGQPAGQVDGFKYSKALKESGVIWDEATFNDFILKPKAVIKRTKMSFGGIKKATQREDLLAYFRTLRDQDSASLPAGNIEEGIAAAAKYCTVCHSFEKGGKVVFGPNLFGVAGQPAGEVEGFKYSQALKDSGLIWTDSNMVGFLSEPETFLKGTTARFPGLKSAKDKADILAYMKSLN